MSPPRIIFPSSCFPAVLSLLVHLFGKAVYWCRSEIMKRFLTSASAILSPWGLCMLLEYMDLTSDNREMIKTPQRPCPVLCSVMSDSCDPHWLQPSRLVCPWDSPGKNTGVGHHSPLQGIFLPQGSSLWLLHWQADSLPAGVDSLWWQLSAYHPGKQILGQSHL